MGEVAALRRAILRVLEESNTASGRKLFNTMVLSLGPKG